MTTTGELAENLVHRVNVGDSLTRTAARYPTRTALVGDGRSVTYAEFDAAVSFLTLSRPQLHPPAATTQAATPTTAPRR